jgi:hypothetical protein
LFFEISSNKGALHDALRRVLVAPLLARSLRSYASGHHSELLCCLKFQKTKEKNRFWKRTNINKRRNTRRDTSTRWMVGIRTLDRVPTCGALAEVPSRSSGRLCREQCGPVTTGTTILCTQLSTPSRQLVRTTLRGLSVSRWHIPLPSAANALTPHISPRSLLETHHVPQDSRSRRSAAPCGSTALTGSATHRLTVVKGCRKRGSRE